MTNLSLEILLDNLNFISWFKVESNLEWLQATILIGGNETTNTIYCSQKRYARSWFLQETAKFWKTLKKVV